MAEKSGLGYQSLRQEVTLDSLPIEGAIPSWLGGKLYRNGPALYEVGEYRVNHMFDGLAMIHKFEFNNGQIAYANKFLRTDSYNLAMERGIMQPGFAGVTKLDGTPVTLNLGGEYGSRNGLPNANVSIASLNRRLLALTETSIAVEFDGQSLDTVGAFPYTQKVPGQWVSAHPHYDYGYNQQINYAVNYGRETFYNIYSVAAGSYVQKPLASVPVREAAYMHSFAMTDNYVILAEFPYLADVSKLMSGAGILGAFTWKPELGTRFLVVDKRDGSVVGTYQGEAFMAYHFANAYERGNTIVMDVAAYSGADGYDNLNLKNAEEKPSKDAEYGKLQRCYLDLNKAQVDYEILSSESIEFPTVSYQQYNGKPYSYTYGVSHREEQASDGQNQLLKANVENGTAQRWYAENCYPGEPIFVARPNATQEDDGAVLSLVLDSVKERSFLLVLDGQTFEEIARAELPHHVPFGLHGYYQA